VRLEVHPNGHLTLGRMCGVQAGCIRTKEEGDDVLKVQCLLRVRTAFLSVLPFKRGPKLQPFSLTAGSRLQNQNSPLYPPIQFPGLESRAYLGLAHFALSFLLKPGFSKALIISPVKP
jgi:hypothetical protein